MTPKTRWKTEFCRLLSYRQSFVKSIGVFPGPWSILLKKHPVLKELIIVYFSSRPEWSDTAQLFPQRLTQRSKNESFSNTIYTSSKGRHPSLV